MRKNSELAHNIRRTAYFLWEQDGSPEASSLHYWLKAKEMHIRQLAYDRWLAEGAPIARADANWFDAADHFDD